MQFYRIVGDAATSGAKAMSKPPGVLGDMFLQYNQLGVKMVVYPNLLILCMNPEKPYPHTDLDGFPRFSNKTLWRLENLLTQTHTSLEFNRLFFVFCPVFSY
jgi:hypothetical protein